jgi:hypothetical protein
MFDIQMDPNDTSANIFYNIDQKIKAKNGIIVEYVDASHKTYHPFILSEKLLLAKGTINSNDNQKTEVKIPEINRVQTALFSKFEQKIFYKPYFPKHWSEEGIAQPHAASKEKCFAVCKKLFINDLLIPDSILATKEEGMYISYDRITSDFDRTMIIEIYNTLETALIICDNFEKKTIYNEDITEMDFSHAVAVFKS